MTQRLHGTIILKADLLNPEIQFFPNDGWKALAECKHKCYQLTFFLDFPIKWYLFYTNFGDDNNKYLAKLNLPCLTSMGPKPQQRIISDQNKKKLNEELINLRHY